MDKKPDNIGSTNLPPSLIPYDNYYLTDSSVSVLPSGGIICCFVMLALWCGFLFWKIEDA